MELLSWTAFAIAVCVLFHCSLLVLGIYWLQTTSTGWPDPPKDASEVVAAGTHAIDVVGTRKAYYDWSENLPEAHLGSAKFFGLCLIPKRSTVSIIVDHIRKSGCQGISSLGSGPALLEWLLAEHIAVECVDQFYQNNGADPWCCPPVQKILKQAVGTNNMTFVHSGPGCRPAVVSKTNAMLWCWPVMTTEVVFNYMAQYEGDCVVVIGDHTCTPSAEGMAGVLCADTARSTWVTSLATSSASTVGRPCFITVFSRFQKMS